MQIRFIPQHTGRLHWIVKVLLREFLQSVVGLLIYQVALLDPTFGAARRAHPGKALLVLQNLHPLAVLHGSHVVIDGSHPVAQRGLSNRYVVDFQHPLAPAAARGNPKQQDSCDEEQGAPIKMQSRREFHHLFYEVCFQSVSFTQLTPANRREH